MLAVIPALRRVSVNSRLAWSTVPRKPGPFRNPVSKNKNQNKPSSVYPKLVVHLHKKDGL